MSAFGPWCINPATGRIYSQSLGVISYYFRGIPYDSSGRVCFNATSSVDHDGAGGIPFASDGRVSVYDGGAGTVNPHHWSSGLPFWSDGRLLVRQIIPTISYHFMGLPFQADGRLVF